MRNKNELSAVPQALYNLNQSEPLPPAECSSHCHGMTPGMTPGMTRPSVELVVVVAGDVVRCSIGIVIIVASIGSIVVASIGAVIIATLPTCLGFHCIAKPR